MPEALGRRPVAKDQLADGAGMLTVVERFRDRVERPVADPDAAGRVGEEVAGPGCVCRTRPRRGPTDRRRRTRPSPGGPAPCGPHSSRSARTGRRRRARPPSRRVSRTAAARPQDGDGAGAPDAGAAANRPATPPEPRMVRSRASGRTSSQRPTSRRTNRRPRVLRPATRRRRGARCGMSRAQRLRCHDLPSVWVDGA